MHHEWWHLILPFFCVNTPLKLVKLCLGIGLKCPMPDVFFPSFQATKASMMQKFLISLTWLCEILGIATLGISRNTSGRWKPWAGHNQRVVCCLSGKRWPMKCPSFVLKEAVTGWLVWIFTSLVWWATGNWQLRKFLFSPQKTGKPNGDLKKKTSTQFSSSW